MSRFPIRILAIAVAFFCLAGLVRAQVKTDLDDSPPNPSGNLSDIPFAIEYQFVPKYFVQFTGKDSRYSSIEALIFDNSQPPWYEVVLTERTTGRKIFYSNSKEEIGSLREDGTDAYYTSIDFTSLETLVSSFVYRIRLRDNRGQEINWKFIVDPRAFQTGAGIMSKPDESGFILIFADLWFISQPETAVTIGTETSRVDLSSASENGADFGADQAFYAMDLTIAKFTPAGRPLFAGLRH